MKTTKVEITWTCAKCSEKRISFEPSNCQCGEGSASITPHEKDCTNCKHGLTSAWNYPDVKCNLHNMTTGLGETCVDFKSRTTALKSVSR